VFASHAHKDHFNPEIFHLISKSENVEFVLSADIKVTAFHIKKWKATPDQIKKIVTVKADQTYDFDDGTGEKMILSTLKSTDCGVAFLLKYQGKTIFHAGDLNWWVWKGESKQYNHNMTANFKAYMESMRDIYIDVAFMPLDKRQGADYLLGMDYLLELAKVDKVFPMHFWEDYFVIPTYEKERKNKEVTTKIMRIEYPSQIWENV
jgi:L-ascorbate metabolism protein UlaG (beta-lactamase superfamily)